MDTRIVLYVIIILLGIIVGGSGKDVNRKKQKWYVISILTLLILESSLRSLSVGTDTMGYYNDFESIKGYSWSNIWGAFSATYQQGEGKDPGFAVFVKLVQLFSGDFNFFLFISALLFFIPLGLILYNYSSHILQLVFAFTLYVALFHIVALSGIRQQIATGFTFLALLEMGKGKKWRSLLFVGIGSIIHISALIFLLVPVLSLLNRKYLKPIHLASFFTIPIVIVYSSAIMLFAASFIENDYYSSYGAGESNREAYFYIFLMELLSLFCYISIKKEHIMKSSSISRLYIMLPLLTLTVPLISLNGAMIRIGQYFTLYMMLLAPISFDLFLPQKLRASNYIIMIIALMFLSLNSSSFNYSFFWQ